MKDEIRAAIGTVKSTGPDSISVGLLEALEDYGIDKIATVFNEIYNSIQIPPDISKFIYIYSTAKKPGATSVNHIERSNS